MKIERQNDESGLALNQHSGETVTRPSCPRAGQSILCRGDLPPTIGPYRVIRLIGGGGTGRVYLARDRDGKLVAVKVAATSDSGVESLAREATACMAVDHPNIVRAVAAGRDRSLAYLALEHVAGLTVGQLVRTSGRLPARAVAECGRQAAGGLARLHATGWVHRDVKPANLMRTFTGRVKLIDLGAADRVDGETRLPVGWGTMPYLAPELARRPDLVDPRSDIYGLGAVLYFLLTGRPPGPNGTDAGLLLWALTADTRPVPRLGRRVPAGLASIIRRMLAPDPTKRIPSAARVAELLADWAALPTSPTALSPG